MSSWSNKLETRISALADGASKESLQTLAKWMGFNRKHGVALATALAEAIQKAGPSRKWLYLQLTHEVFMLNIDDIKKWERLADMRTTFGETVLLPSVAALHGDERLEDLLNQWEEHSVLGSPTLLAQIRKAYSNPSEASDAEPAVTASVNETEAAGSSSPVSETIQKDQEAKKDDVINMATFSGPSREEDDQQQMPMSDSKGSEEKALEIEAEPDQAETTPTPISTTPQEEKPPQAPSELNAAPASPAPPTNRPALKFDFEKEGIPQGKVDSREFLEPCRAIATLQIARDLRSDTAVQLSSLLSAIPENALNICKAAKDEEEKTGVTPELSEEDLNELCKHFNDEVLELDLEESLQNIETFGEIVEKQSAARRRLIHLLVRSRCQFGAADAAEAFYKLDETSKLLQKRKELLLDAMALEGLDFEEDKPVPALNEMSLPPLTWYHSSEPDAKRARFE